MEKKIRIDGFPAEWSAQGAVLLAWPHEDTDWQPIMREVIPCYVRIVNEILRRERVIIVCQSKQSVLSDLGKSVEDSRLSLIEIPSNDTWVRDYGPISVFRDGQPAVLDFTFNGWGLKFEAQLDNQITERLYASGLFSSKTNFYPISSVLEGGSLESDGQGTILTTSRCLLAPNRNDFSDIEAAETLLKTLPGVRRTLWLHHGHLAGDDTDGHIDTLARFCDPTTIAYVQCTDPEDEHFSELALMERELAAFRTLSGDPYRLLPLPLPEAVYEAGERLPATYANFLIINGAVLMPTYQSPLDRLALEALQGVFPDREVIGLDCLPLIKQHGSLHCATMQIPLEIIS